MVSSIIRTEAKLPVKTYHLSTGEFQILRRLRSDRDRSSHETGIKIQLGATQLRSYVPTYRIGKLRKTDVTDFLGDGAFVCVCCPLPFDDIILDFDLLKHLQHLRHIFPLEL